MSQQSISDLVMTDVNRFHVRIDQIGVGLSLACAVHCLAAPLLLTALPLLGLSFLADDMTEVVLLSSALVLAAGSLCWGFRRHKSGRVFLALGRSRGTDCHRQAVCRGSLGESIGGCRSCDPSR